MILLAESGQYSLSTKFKFKGEITWFQCVHLNCGRSKMIPSISHTPSSIVSNLFDDDMILNSIKYLGPGIRRIKLFYLKHRRQGNHFQNISKFINKYCHETLRQLEIKGSEENTPVEMTKPFRKVEQVSFDWGLPA